MRVSSFLPSSTDIWVEGSDDSVTKQGSDFGSEGIVTCFDVLLDFNQELCLFDMDHT